MVWKNVQAAGKLKSTTAPDGKKTKYIYDKKGFLTKVSYPDSSVQFGYDAQGNRVWMKDADRRWSRTD